MSDAKDVILEFIMVYGWAILVVISALGALWYFGVINPNALYNKTMDRTCCEGVCDGFSQVTGRDFQCMQVRDGYAICGNGYAFFDDDLVSISERYFISLKNITSCNHYWTQDNQTIEGSIFYKTPFISMPEINMSEIKKGGSS